MKMIGVVYRIRGSVSLLTMVWREVRLMRALEAAK